MAGLILLYAFNEGEGDVVHDLSGFETPLDLHISPMDRVRWLDPNGIEILRPAILRSQDVVTKLVKALKATHEISIEVWVTPNNLRQGGPARILSFSQDSGARNFTLGQEGSEIQFRLRTPVSGRNGTPLALITKDGFSTPGEFHVVATYKNGIERLYINGKQRSEVLNLTSEGIVGFGTRRTPIALTAYSFFYFFPVTFICAIFFLRRSRRVTKTLLLPAAIGIGLLSITETFQAIAFHRAVDISLIIYGVVVAALGTLSGQLFETREAVRYFPSAA
jgi:Concanavalin A-like lectin/glucanases superfamily